MLIKAYVHGSKESMRDAGEQAGLSEKALGMFVFACSEIEVLLDVDEQTGKARIIKVDNRLVTDEQ